MNRELQELIDACNSTKEKILSYVECSVITEKPRAVLEDEKGDSYTVEYEDGIWGYSAK